MTLLMKSNVCIRENYWTCGLVMTSSSKFLSRYKSYGVFVDLNWESRFQSRKMVGMYAAQAIKAGISDRGEIIQERVTG
jgi:hypothetical protein